MVQIGTGARDLHRRIREDYIRQHGWRVVVVPFREKGPQTKDWPDIVIGEADVEKHFKLPSNVGVILGEASGGLVDIDLDKDIACLLAENFLRDTLIFGRDSKPKSHWLYAVTDRKLVTRRFQDPITHHTFLELRANASTGPGIQTVFPGSVHQSGEEIEFDYPAPLLALPGDQLVADVTDLAIACLLHERWADGVGEAIAPAFAAAGWDWTRISRVVQALERALDASMPSTAVAGDPWAALTAAWGALGARLVRQLRTWLGLPEQAPPSPPRKARRGGHGDILNRARRHLATLPGSIAGQNGHEAAWRAAISLVVGFALDPSTAMDLLQSEFNPKCRSEDGRPYPWSIRELEHKIRDAHTKTRLPLGYLRDAPMEAPMGSAVGSRPAPQRPIAGTNGVAPPAPADAAEPDADDADDAAESPDAESEAAAVEEADPDIKEREQEPDLSDLAAIETALHEDNRIAWDPPFIRAAARLPEASTQFQDLLTALKRANVRIRPWEKENKAWRRKLLARQAARLAAAATGLDPHASEDDRIEAVRSLLQMNAEGNRPEKSIANLNTVIKNDPRFFGRIGYHVMRETPMMLDAIRWAPDAMPTENEPGPWTDHLTVCAADLIGRDYRLNAPTTMVMDAVMAVSRQHLIDPKRDYFEKVHSAYDGKARLDSWLTTYCGVPASDYTRAIGARWLISGVARSFQPGCKVDCVLILEGAQGAGKSTVFRILAVEDQYFLDTDIDFAEKDGLMMLRGKHIIEFQELASFSRADVNRQKSFVSRTFDTYRPPFRTAPGDFPRRCIFGGSTNLDEYLMDDTGGRRFWPVRVTRIDIAALGRDVHLLWGEAVHRYQKGEPHFVDTPELKALCEAEQAKRQIVDVWDEIISSKVKDYDETTVGDVLGMLGVDKSKWDRSAQMRVARILSSIGFKKDEKLTTLPGGARVRYYHRQQPKNGVLPYGTENDEVGL